MSKWTIAIVFIVAILIGISITIASNYKPQSSAKVVAKQGVSTPTIQPTPTPLPIDEKTDLSNELKTLTPESFQSDYQSLK